jgi:low affinity Fe/Cu permease
MSFIGNGGFRMDWFRTAAAKVARLSGHPVVFLLACLSIVGWGVSGPIFGYSDTWQLVINTSTTVITFLMVFLIQNSQTRDSDAMHLKLDELLRALDEAQTDFCDLEDRSEQEIQELHAKYARLAEAAKKEVEGRATKPRERPRPAAASRRAKAS